MLSPFTAALLQLGILLTGQYVGPDYRMLLSETGRAEVLYVDQSYAVVQFDTLTRDDRGVIFSMGTVISSTVTPEANVEHLRTGDQVFLNYTSHTLAATLASGRPLRTSHTICWQGFNQEPGHVSYPC